MDVIFYKRIIMFITQMRFYLYMYIYILVFTYIYIYIYFYRKNPDSLILPGDKWGLPPCQVGTSASQQGDCFQVFVFQKDDLAQIYPEKTKRPGGFQKNICRFSQKTEHGRLPLHPEKRE